MEEGESELGIEHTSGVEGVAGGRGVRVGPSVGVMVTVGLSSSRTVGVMGREGGVAQAERSMRRSGRRRFRICIAQF